MPFTFGGAHNPGTDGTFATPNPQFDAAGGLRAKINGDDGLWHGYAFSGNTDLRPMALVTPNAAKLAANAAAATAASNAASAEQTRANQVATALANLDAQTATLNQVQTYLAALARFTIANVPRPT